MYLKNNIALWILCALIASGCSSLRNGFLGFAPIGDKKEYVQARTLYNQQNYTQAVEELTEYIYKAGNVKRREARAYRLLGMSYEQLGQLDKALETYLEALEFHPKNIALLTAAAGLYQRAGLTDKSQVLYQRALELNPDHLEALAGQAENYHTLGFFSQARAYYDRFFELNPDASPQYRARYATTFLNQSNYEQAFIHSTMALMQDPYQADYWLIQSKAAFSMKRFEEAIAAIDTALSLAPQRTDLQLYKIIGAYQNKHFASSRKLAKLLVKNHPHSQLGWFMLALNEWELGLKNTARTHLRACIELNSTSFTGRVATQLLQEWK